MATMKLWVVGITLALAVVASAHAQDEEVGGSNNSTVDRAECLALAASFARGGAPADEEKRKASEAKLANCMDRGRAMLTSSSVATELVRTVAQVVLDRAKRRGVQLLRERVLELARCDKAGGPFERTCSVVESTDIESLIASPEVLLDAFKEDLLAYLQARIDAHWSGGLTVKADLHAGISFVSSALTIHGDNALTKKVAEGSMYTCPEQSTTAALAWVVAWCAVETGSGQPLANCQYTDKYLDRCSETQANAVREVLPLAQKALSRDGTRADRIGLAFELAGKDFDQIPDAWLDALRDVSLGLEQKDWVRVVSGATRVITLTVEKVCADHDLRKKAADAQKDACNDDAKTVRLLALVGAVGNYAETYNVEDAAAASAAREKVVAELIDRVGGRSKDRRGTAVGLGGNLGLIGGVRTDWKGGEQAAFPLQLGLGVGLDTYHTRNGGFHAMLTVLDLGQYITLDDKDLKVEEPDMEDAVLLSVTLGGHFGPRDMPLYLGPQFGVSPFVRSKDENRLTYQLGLVLGLYVPLIDFH